MKSSKQCVYRPSVPELLQWKSLKQPQFDKVRSLSKVPLPSPAVMLPPLNQTSGLQIKRQTSLSCLYSPFFLTFSSSTVLHVKVSKCCHQTGIKKRQINNTRRGKRDFKKCSRMESDFLPENWDLRETEKPVASLEFITPSCPRWELCAVFIISIIRLKSLVVIAATSCYTPLVPASAGEICRGAGTGSQTFHYRAWHKNVWLDGAVGFRHNGICSVGKPLARSGPPPAWHATAFLRQRRLDGCENDLFTLSLRVPAVIWGHEIHGGSGNNRCQWRRGLPDKFTKRDELENPVVSLHLFKLILESCRALFQYDLGTWPRRPSVLVWVFHVSVKLAAA